MGEKPRILQAVSEMMAQGLSDDEIVQNLRAVGLSNDQIRKVMEVAKKDSYTVFKRDMAQFFDQRIKSNTNVIDRMVEESLARKKQDNRNDLSDEVQDLVGDFAKEVNEKSHDMELTVKKLREENMKMRKTEQINRADIDILLSGSSRYRMMISVSFLITGVLIFLFDIFAILPDVKVYFDNGYPQQAALQAILVFSFIAFAIAALAVGVYFSGRPGRQ
ncbi:hypothetical protein K8R43_01770 [archaeon]|nr:hypothetical protein [archaeon]